MKRLIAFLLCVIIVLSVALPSLAYDLEVLNKNDISLAKSIENHEESIFPTEDSADSESKRLINQLNKKDDISNPIDFRNNNSINELTKNPIITDENKDDEELSLRQDILFNNVGAISSEKSVTFNSILYGDFYVVNLEKNDKYFYYITTKGFIFSLDPDTGSFNNKCRLVGNDSSLLLSYSCGTKIYALYKVKSTGKYIIKYYNIETHTASNELVLENIELDDDYVSFVADYKDNIFITSRDSSKLYEFNMSNNKIGEIDLSSYLKYYDYIATAGVSHDGKSLMIYLYSSQRGDFTGWVKIGNNGKFENKNIINITSGFKARLFLDNTTVIDNYLDIYQFEPNNKSLDLTWQSGFSSNTNLVAYLNEKSVYTMNCYGDLVKINTNSYEVEKHYEFEDKYILDIFVYNGRIYLVCLDTSKNEFCTFSLLDSDLIDVQTNEYNTNTAKTHTKQNIIDKYNNTLPTFNYSTNQYNVQPDIANYKEGTLKNQVLVDTKNQLDYFRYLYGIEKGLSNWSQYNSNNQKGALLLSITNEFAHYPEQPAGMPNDFYQSAIKGTGSGTTSDGYGWSGNISMGDFMPDSILGYVDESQNVEPNVGHRLSLLSTDSAGFSAGYTDVGVGNIKYDAISIYHDKSSSAQGNTDVFYTWPPAGYCPIDVTTLTAMWSIKLNEQFNYNIHSVNNIKIKFTVEDVTETIGFENLYYDDIYKAFYFKVPNIIINALSGGMGNKSFLPNKKVKVEFTGLTDDDENKININYTTEFFAINDVKPNNIIMYVEGSSSYYDSNPRYFVDSQYAGIYNLDYAFTPNNVTDKRLTYTIEDNNIVDIDLNKGLITYKNPGKTLIHFTSVATNKEIAVLECECIGYRNLFDDVKGGKWYYNYIDYVNKNNIMTGYNSKTFGTNDSITRGQFATLLYRSAGSPDVSGTVPLSDITDTNAWYYKAVVWAYQKGIIIGYQDDINYGKFLPYKNISRQELAVMLMRYAKFTGNYYEKEQDLSEYKDKNNVASWALSAVKWCVYNNIMSGRVFKNYTLLEPVVNATRAETASMITRYRINFN